MSVNIYNLTIFFNAKLLNFFKIMCANLFQNVLPEKQGNFVYNREVVYLDFKQININELQEVLTYCDALKPSRLVTKCVIEKQ